MSRMLGEICCEAPVDTNLDAYKVELKDAEKAVRYMAKLELFSLIDKLGLRDEPVSQEETEVKTEEFEVLQLDDKTLDIVNFE